jgi:hypothetical protein
LIESLTQTGQAILSQFSHTKSKAKAKAAINQPENSDREELESESEIEENEDEDMSDTESDEVEPAVEENDNAKIDKIAADPDTRLSPLTEQEIKLGRYSVAKVCGHCLAQMFSQF